MDKKQNILKECAGIISQTKKAFFIEKVGDTPSGKQGTATANIRKLAMGVSYVESLQCAHCSQSQRQYHLQDQPSTQRTLTEQQRKKS